MNQTFTLPKGLPRDKQLERVGAVLRALPVDKAWRIDVIEQKRTRSDPQNRYLWGVVYPTILSAPGLDGWDANDVHEYLLGEHFGWELIEVFGKKRQRPIRRSAKLSVSEFMAYIEFIQRKMAEHGIFIPDPL
jgi:hypothetical protein